MIGLRQDVDFVGAAEVEDLPGVESRHDGRGAAPPAHGLHLDLALVFGSHGPGL